MAGISTWLAGTMMLLALGAGTAAAGTATAVGDAVDGGLLATEEGDEPVESPLATSLLVVEVLRQDLARGVLRPTTPVAVTPVPGDGGPRLGAVERLPAGELLQLLLLTGSPTAARSLAATLGPDPTAIHARLARTAAGAGIDAAPGAQVFRASARGLALLAMRVVADPALRRRLERDGVPIADGQMIVRASAPLVAIEPVAGTPEPAGRRTAVVLGRRGNLELIAAATGERPLARAREALAAALAAYARHAIVRTGQEVGPAIEVPNGIIPRFTAVAAEPFAVTARRGTTPDLAIRLQIPASVEAPVDVRQAVGELVLEHQGVVVAVVPLVAPRTIAPRRWLDSSIALPGSGR